MPAKKIFGLLVLRMLLSFAIPCEAVHSVKTPEELYAAITGINNGDADTFIALSENITLTAPLPPISKSMTFQSDKLGTSRTVNANAGRDGKRRVFHVLSGFGLTVKFQDLEITGGHADRGGGVFIEAPRGKIVFVYCRIIGNRADCGGGVCVRRAGTVAFNHCGIYRNSAPRRGGGLAIEEGDIALNLSEVSDNTAGLSAGGLYLSRDATLRLNRTAVGGNKAKGHADNLSTE
jgi:hypothetical protein